MEAGFLPEEPNNSALMQAKKKLIWFYIHRGKQLSVKGVNTR